MTIEVLMSAMNQKDLNIVEKSNIHSNCIIINQGDTEGFVLEDREYGTIRMISTTERGVSKSRNMALANSLADICVLCDDDIVYHEGYENSIIKAFQDVPYADILVFNINRLNASANSSKPFVACKKIPWYKFYGSVHVAFRRKSVLESALSFDERFGSGSGMYSMAEDSLFFADAHKKGLSAYTHPTVIADLAPGQSTWFKGFNERYFFDTGAYLQAAFPKMKYILCLFFLIKFYGLKKETDLNAVCILKWVWKGIIGCKLGLSYQEYTWRFTASD